MKHYGDITKLSGYTLPVVDIITGGSPCQDLSVAGNRAGLAGERSGLFMEQIRIVKEMRERDRRTGRTGWLIRPRFMVWENVPGAFSSNKGRDFQAVLSEIVKIAEPDAPDVPLPGKGKWPKAGCLYSDVGAWSVAWRLHDAQFWGVPQRRKRIALVADFGGLAAPEILFEREGLSGYSEPSGEAGQETAGAAGEGVEGASCYGLDHVMLSGGTTYQGRGYYDNVSGCLKTQPHGVCETISFQERGGKPGGGKGILIQNERTGALSTLNNQNVFCLNDQGGSVMAFAQNQVGEVRVSHMSGTLNTNSNASGRNSPLVYDARGNGDGKAVVYENHSQDSRYKPFGDVCETVNAKYGTGGNNQPLVVSDVLPFDTTQVTSDKNWSNPHYGDPCHPLAAQAHVPSIASPSIIRRLTPIECERLQGYPSKKMVDVSQMTKDEYIAWNLAEGNIIANQERGKVYGTRGPGGCPYKEPKELKGSDVNGYKVVSIRNGATKLQCRVHRIIWISAHGIIPDGYVIDHINNDKTDNRLENLQLLTPEQNSQKAQADGLYKSGLDNKATKLDPDLKDEIAFLYEYSDLTMRNLAELYGVSKSRIAQIVHEVGWTDIGDWVDSKGKKHKEADSPRYKALGNSIALPFWAWMARRICAQYERPMTMGSLFDGIGGFPLVFERAGAKAVWASEIEEFCVAVTKKHFPEEVTNER